MDVAAFAPLAAGDSGGLGAGPLAGLGATVEEVSASLLGLLQDTATSTSLPSAATGNGDRPADPRVDQLAGELLAAIE